MWISTRYMAEKSQQDGCPLIHPFSRAVYTQRNPRECHSFTPQHFRSQACMVAYACGPSTWEAEAGGRWSLTTVWATGWFQAILRYGVRSCLTWMTPPCAWPSLGLVSILVQVVRYALTEQEILQTARLDGMFSAQTCWDKKWKWKEGGKQASKSEITERLILFCWKVEYGNLPNTRKTLKSSPLMLTWFRV